MDHPTRIPNLSRGNRSDPQYQISNPPIPPDPDIEPHKNVPDGIGASGHRGIGEVQVVLYTVPTERDTASKLPVCRLQAIAV
jgi:hypothetical protein